MKILLTTDTLGGVWTYALELARALRPWNVEVVLAATGAPVRADQKAAAARIENLRLESAPYRLEWMPNPWDDVGAAGAWLLKFAHREQVDLVHLNEYAHAALDWSAPVLVVGHSCVCSWYEAVRKQPAGAAWNRYRQVVTRGLHAADLVVAPTAAMLAALQTHYGPLPSTQVINNGRRFPLRSEVTKQPFILGAGRLWDDAKNLRALTRCAEQFNWPVHLAGDATHPDGLPVKFPGVNHLGHLNESAIAQAMAQASIYALPAYYEPFGLSALEAALAGCALILGDIDSLREVWADAAWFVPPDDDAALVHAINTLATQPTLLKNFSARARHRAARYTAERMAAGYYDAYQNLLAAPPVRRSLSPESV